MKNEKVIRERVKEALAKTKWDRKPKSYDKVIEDMVIILAEKHMSSDTALKILDDTKAIIPLISEIKLL